MNSAILLAIKIGLDPELFEVAGIQITWHGLFTAVGVMVGVAVAAILGRRAGFNEDSIYGALMGGMLGAGGYALVTRLPNIPQAADIASMGGIMGMAVGRIGDVINGEHFAESTDLPWGVRYTDPSSPS